MTGVAVARPARTDGGAGVGHRRLITVGVLCAIALVAFLARLAIMVRGGGLTVIAGYDDGVYYAAADALVHGRLPYRDFLLVQPPLIAVVTAPFAAFGALVSDSTGFAVARVAYMLIGAANAVLCGAILRRYGVTAMIVGGFGYAIFYPAVYAERSVLLEPLGTLGILLALLLLQRAEARPNLAVLAGVAAGLGVGAKIWYLVPAILLVLAARRVRLRYLIGVAVGGCAIYLPFLVAAPQRMVQEVVLDQFGRGISSVGPLRRLEGILGARATVGVPLSAIAPVLALVAASAVATALLTRGARVLGLLAVATTAVLLLTPSWFQHYSALTAPPLALCIGLAAGRLSDLLQGRRRKALLAAVLLLGVLVANEANDRSRVGKPTPAALGRAASVVQGCVTADDPSTLIEMNVLSRDLSDPRCSVWPDVTGWTYDPHDVVRAADGSRQGRALNARWQSDVLAHMESGDATIRTRGGTGFSAASKRVIDSGEVLFRTGRYVVHATDHD